MRIKAALIVNMAYTHVVVLWGALVRATGSGAGCGAHWPLCHRQVMPVGAELATFLEWMHRAMSGVLMLTVVWACIASFRAFAAPHPARRWSVVVVVMVLGEAAIGAALVLLRLVGEDASPLRAYVMGAHLINTFVLMAAQGVHLWVVDQPQMSVRALVRKKIARGWVWPLSGGVMLMISATGAMVALGDTLFPAASLSDGWQAARDNTHFLVRLRLWHPVVAVMGALFMGWWGLRLITQHGVQRVVFWAKMLVMAVVLQLAIGVINWALLVPVYTQLAHLWGAIAVWMAWLVLGLEERRNTVVPQG